MPDRGRDQNAISNRQTCKGNVGIAQGQIGSGDFMKHGQVVHILVQINFVRGHNPTDTRQTDANQGCGVVTNVAVRTGAQVHAVGQGQFQNLLPRRWVGVVDHADQFRERAERGQRIGRWVACHLQHRALNDALHVV